MKKYINLAFFYAIAAMAGGVFYREFTKFNGFTGRTTLAFLHTHLFLLGMVVFLLAALFVSRIPLTGQKTWKPFLVIHQIGVILTSVMMTVRGVLQVLAVPLTSAQDAMVSGISGLGHLLTGVGIILFFLALRRAAGTKAA